MIFQTVDNLVNVCFCLCVFCLHGIKLVGVFLKETKEALFLFLVKVLKLGDNSTEHLTDFTKVLGAHIFQRTFRKVRHFLLCTSSVLQNHAGISKVNLCCKIVYHFAFLLGKHTFIKNRL